MARKDDEGLGVLMAFGSPKAGKGAESDDSAEEKRMAAQGVLDAIERGDAGALSRALEEHYASCQGMGPAKEPDSDEY